MKKLIIILALIAVSNTVNAQLVEMHVEWQKKLDPRLTNMGLSKSTMSPDAKYVYTTGSGRTISVMDYESGEFLYSFQDELSSPLYVGVRMRCSKDGKYLLVPNIDFLEIFDTKNGRKLAQYSLGYISSTDFTANSDIIISHKNSNASEPSRTITHMNWKTGEIEKTINTNSVLNAQTCQTSTDGKLFVVAGIKYYGGYFEQEQELIEWINDINIYDTETLELILDVNYELYSGSENTGYNFISLDGSYL